MSRVTSSMMGNSGENHKYSQLTYLELNVSQLRTYVRSARNHWIISIGVPDGPKPGKHESLVL